MNAQANNGVTALMMTVSQPDEDMIDFLLEKGKANPCIKDNIGDTAKSYAIKLLTDNEQKSRIIEKLEAAEQRLQAAETY